MQTLTDGIIAVLMPTRGKPLELVRIAQEIESTSERAMLFAYVANDDPKLDAYREVRDMGLTRMTVIIGEPRGFSGGVNYLASLVKNLTPKPTLLLRCEDDFFFYNGWEQAYLGVVPADGIAMIWCNYVHKGKNAEPQTAAITMKWYETLGWFSLPGIKHFFCDNVLGDLGAALGRAIYLPDPYIIHKWNPNDPRKESHQHMWTADEARYRFWNRQEFEDDAWLLRRAMNG